VDLTDKNTSSSYSLIFYPFQGRIPLSLGSPSAPITPTTFPRAFSNCSKNWDRVAVIGRKGEESRCTATQVFVQRFPNQGSGVPRYLLCPLRGRVD